MLLCSTVSSLLVARLLGPSGKGVLSTAIIVGGLVGLLIEPGLRAGVIRTIAAGRAGWREGLATMALVYGVLCILVLPLLAVLLWNAHGRWFHDIPYAVLLLALAGVPVGLFEGSLTALLIGQQRMPEVSGIWALERAGALAGLLLLVWLSRWGVLGGMLAQLGGTVLGIGLLWHLLARMPAATWRVRHDLLPALLRFGVLWYARNLATSLNYRLDALIVFILIGPYEAGLYAVAVSLAELLQQLPSSIDAVLFPRVSRGDMPDAARSTARLSRCTVLVTVLGGVALALLARPLLLLFGAQFTQGYWALVLLLPGMVVLGQSKVICSDMLGRGEGRYPALASWSALLGTIALDCILIPRWGIAGAAFASTIAYSMGAFVALRGYRAMTGVGVVALYGIRPAEIALGAQRLGGLLLRARGRAVH
jgi:O-antigen/teichoic acid export membrane protein